MLLPVLAAIGLVAVATALGLLWRARDGSTRRGSGERIRPADVAAAASAFGERATLLQFSTEFCTRCPATRRVLGDVAATTAGVTHVDVDLTHRPDLASRYSVLQTPTTLVLDARGVVRARIAGAPRPTAVAETLSGVLDAAQPQGAR
jgi:thiol-disulfide isomerase/thioredoxin